MDLRSIPLFQAISRRLSWLNERQAVLAQNVANANTPGYLAEDVKPVGFHQLVTGGGGHLALTITAPGQLQGVDAGKFASAKDPITERTLSGNAVDLESEMMKVAETTADHQLVTDIYKKQLGMIKTALGKGG